MKLNNNQGENFMKRKANPDAKIQMTLTGAEVNVLEHILWNQEVCDINSPLLMTLIGKLQIKQLKNPSTRQI